MKKTSLIIILISFGLLVWSQGTIPMLGNPAPAFRANTTNGKLEFPEDYGKHWKILLSHPKDFTPVCTSEILHLAEMQDEFNELGVKLAILSTDELSSHHEWKNRF